METIIIVSVLATLGVVALVSTIVVALIKLSKKVDVTENNQQHDEIYREVSQRDEEIRRLIIEVNNNIASQLDNVYREIEDTKKFIDSRCDKLDSKITSTKKVLKD
jgi:phage host-nuclease inhibitor protein Gam